MRSKLLNKNSPCTHCNQDKKSINLIVTQSGELMSDECNSARMKNKIDRAVTSLNDEAYMITKVFDTYRDSLHKNCSNELHYEHKLRHADGYHTHQKEDHELATID